jgi:hypothetical protein
VANDSGRPPPVTRFAYYTFPRMTPKDRAALRARIKATVGPHLGEVYPEAFFSPSQGLLFTFDFPKDRFPTRYAAFVTDETDELVCRHIYGLN